jgi:hypothetical protein
MTDTEWRPAPAPLDAPAWVRSEFEWKEPRIVEFYTDGVYLELGNEAPQDAPGQYEWAPCREPTR